MSSSRKFVLAIDQGTTGSRAIILNSSGKNIGKGYVEIKQYYPKPGWVEHDPQEILKSAQIAIRRAIQESGIRSREIAAIGITNQRESTVLWNRNSGRPFHRVIVWQDRRTSSICSELKKRGLEPFVHSRTGLVLDPYFSGTKITWLLKNVPRIARECKLGHVAFGTMDTWLLWNMTGEHATDHTNASRTLLYNIQTKKWDKELCRIFNADPSILPRIENSAAIYGKTLNWPGLPDGIPVTALCGDQQAALYGQGCYRRGEMKNTYGTGCFLVINTGTTRVISKSGILTTIACDSMGHPVYALEGSVFIAGALIQWLRDSLKLIKNASETEKIARSVQDSHGVTVIPAFTGLGAPYWDAEARGAILGLTRGANASHIVRASLEAIALQTYDLVKAIKKEFDYPIKFLKVDGGASKNNFLMQFQSDILGLKVLRSRLVENTAWGVGKMAGVGAGIWNSPVQLDHHIRYENFHPNIQKQKREEILRSWRSQINRILTASSKG